jgi:hypothetical protein
LNRQSRSVLLNKIPAAEIQAGKNTYFCMH